MNIKTFIDSFSKEKVIENYIQKEYNLDFVYPDYALFNKVEELENEILDDDKSQWIFAIPLGPVAIYFDDVKKKWNIVKNPRGELWLRTICEFGWYRISLNSDLFQPKFKVI